MVIFCPATEIGTKLICCVTQSMHSVYFFTEKKNTEIRTHMKNIRRAVTNQDKIHYFVAAALLCKHNELMKQHQGWRRIRVSSPLYRFLCKTKMHLTKRSYEFLIVSCD
jgi:hypothetical protein